MQYVTTAVQFDRQDKNFSNKAYSLFSLKLCTAKIPTSFVIASDVFRAFVEQAGEKEILNQLAQLKTNRHSAQECTENHLDTETDRSSILHCARS